MKEISKTRREIAMYFNLRNKKSVRVLLKRNRPNQKNWEFRILPHRRGRPPKEHIPKVQEKKNEIKRLKIENELLHSFLLSRYIKINGIISSEILHGKRMKKHKSNTARKELKKRITMRFFSFFCLTFLAYYGIILIQ